MNLAEARLGGIRGARIGGAIGDVEFERQEALGETQLRGCGREMIVANIRDDHVHAGAEQRLRDAESDSAGTPGHECGFAWQVLHRSPLDSCCAGAANKALDKPPQVILYLTHTV